MINFRTRTGHATRKALVCLAIGLSVMPGSSCLAQLNSTSNVKGSPRLAEKHYISYDSDQFGYRKWLPVSAPQRQPSLVIIGVHGISGHAGDFDNLGKFLRKDHPDIALYAAETRGQGMDSELSRRGDIRSPKAWYKDLYTFTRLVRQVHPGSKIVWLGESMGSLIIMHAYHQTPPGEQKPDAMVIASPIVEVSAKIPAWKLLAVRLSAMLLPKLRVSLESLSNGQRAVVTKDDIHETQSAENDWYIPRYTLRLLLTLGDMARTMDERASATDCPVMLVHGGRDIFTSEANVKDFFRHFPAGNTTPANLRKYYQGSYHLLMYDHDRERIFKDITIWLGKLNQLP